MATVAAPPMTAGEFFDFVHRPENRDRAFELERGELVEMPRPGVLHGYVCGNIARILGNHSFLTGNGHVCSNDTGIVVESDPDTVRGPDILYFFESIASLDELETRFGTKPAGLAVEVLSPNDRPGQVNRRIRELIAFGTSEVWVVDPELRCVTVYSPGSGRQIQQTTLEANEELVGRGGLSGFRCAVGDFFAVPGK